MKKLILGIAILFCAHAAFAATPLRNGLYINGKAGIMRSEVKAKSQSAKDIVFPMALALGMRVYHFRVEGEYTFATKVEKNNFEAQTELTMGQVYYDVPFKTSIRPFFNVGAGRHTTKVKLGDSFNETRRGWAYNLGAGFTWGISNATNIDIGYRYIRIKDIKAQDETIKPSGHMAYIGWRYVF